ncbi:hypothetical protein JVT61DRAFT_7420 [Boletus reticuloceps]|uniref:Uncharacterized protein n=1 Tax=Boletus reticuloceps TaxID=495285 RepID=A0A8I2YI86_9AGAM|nr:hypothetical protein JVT61DRAFT_7420 [Boletus reticuloceps]
MFSTYVVNLAIIAIMSAITRITNVEIIAAFWEFDPTLPGNHALGGLPHVVAAVCTLAALPIQKTSHTNHIKGVCTAISLTISAR